MPSVTIHFRSKREEYQFGHPKGALIDVEGDHIYLYCRGGAPFEYVKQVLGGRWEQKKSRYKMPRLFYILHDLSEKYSDAEKTELAKSILDSPRGYAGLFTLSGRGHPSWNNLRDYQRESIEWLIPNPHNGGLLALKPGLGKTATAIVGAELLYPNDRKLVVAPLSLLGTWKREVERWGTESLEIHHGSSPSVKAKWTITNYDTVVRHPEYLQTWPIVIADESVLVKSRDAKRSHAILKLREKNGHMWLLSGSPTSRYSDDLWMQYRIIDPKMFTSYWRFAGWTCIVNYDTWGTNIIGDKPGVSFRSVFRDIMHVRLLEETIGLPSQIPVSIDIELEGDQLKVYRDLSFNLKTLLNGAELNVQNKISQLIRLLQTVGGLSNFPDLHSTESAKAKAMVELIESQSFEMPAIVFVHWRGSAEALYSLLRESFPRLRIALALGGQGDLDSLAQQFQSGDLDLLILSLGTGKYGLTLDKAKTVIYHDKTFDGDAYYQSLHRTRQAPIVVISLRARGTVDDLVELNLSGKMQSISHMTNADLNYLLQNLGGV